MAVKVSALILLFSSLCLYAQTKSKKTPVSKSIDTSVSQTAVGDELSRHLSAAETYQLSGDLGRAEIENKIVVGIALQKLGYIALTEKDYKRATKLLTDSVAYHDDSMTRASLAAAYMYLAENDKALAEAQVAVALDEKNVPARQVLGSIYYGKGDSQAALPQLEKVFQLAPDFEGAYLLGMTYLRLQQLERAKLLFEEIQNVISKKNAYLFLLFARAFEENDYPQEADAQYKRAIAFDPKGSKIHFYYGYFLLQHGGTERIHEAEKEFQQELLITPKDFYSHFFLGVIASGENEHVKAIQYLQKAILLDPKIGQAYLFLGQSQLELGEMVAAEKNLRRSIELDTSETKSDLQVRRAYFLLGRLLIRTGRKTEGEKALAKARELQGVVYEQARDEIKKIFGEVVSSRNDELNSGLSPQTSEKEPITAQKASEYKELKNKLANILGQTFNNLAVISVQQGDLPASLEKFAAASEWQPDLPGLDRNWGIVSFRLSQFDKAIAPLARQLKTEPKDNLVRRMLGVSYYFTKDFKQAAATLKPIEAELASDAELSYFYGISLIKSNLNKDAEALFSKIAAQHPQNAQARFYAAQGFVLLENYEKAVSEFRAVATIEPQMPQVHYSAGQSLIRLNRFDEAEKEFRRELEINPSDELAKYHLAFTLLERKIQPDEAVKLLNEAILTKPDYADAHYQLGKILLEKGDTEKAVEHLESAVRYAPEKDYPHYQLSIAYRRLLRTAEADRELKIYRDLKTANRNINSPVRNK